MLLWPRGDPPGPTDLGRDGPARNGSSYPRAGTPTALPEVWQVGTMPDWPYGNASGLNVPAIDGNTCGQIGAHPRPRFYDRQFAIFMGGTVLAALLNREGLVQLTDFSEVSYLGSLGLHFLIAGDAF